MTMETTRDLEAKLKHWAEVLEANRNAQTPEGHAAYEEAVWQIIEIKKRQQSAASGS